MEAATRTPAAVPRGRPERQAAVVAARSTAAAAVHPAAAVVEDMQAVAEAVHPVAAAVHPAAVVAVGTSNAGREDGKPRRLEWARQESGFFESALESRLP
jgi:hypothetical protein